MKLPRQNVNCQDKWIAFSKRVQKATLLVVALAASAGVGTAGAQTPTERTAPVTPPLVTAPSGSAPQPARARPPAPRRGELDPQLIERQRLSQGYAKRLLSEPFVTSGGPETHLMKAPFLSGTRYQKLTPGERAEMSRQAQAIADVIARTPALTAPRGLYPWLRPGDNGSTSEENLGAAVMYGAYAPMWITGNPQTGFKTASGAETSFFIFRMNLVLNVGDPGFANDNNFPIWKDAEGQFSAEPHVIELGNGPLVAGENLLLLPPGAALFKPVSLERALNAQLAVLNERLKSQDSSRAQAARELAEFQSAAAVQERQTRRDAQYQTAVARGATERMLARLRSELDAEDRPHTKRLTESAQISVSAQEVLDAKTLLEAQLASLDPVGKAAATCVRSEPDMWRDGPANWRFGAVAGEACTPLVQTHPTLLKQAASNRALPRNLTVLLRGCTSGLNAERFGKIVSGHPQEINCRHLLALLQEIDWAALRLALYR